MSVSKTTNSGVTITLDERYMKSYTDVRPEPVNKCIHTFKCMFNKDCSSLAKKELSLLSKAELEAMGRNYKIELDRRKKKSVLVQQLYEEILYYKNS